MGGREGRVETGMMGGMAMVMVVMGKELERAETEVVKGMGVESNLEALGMEVVGVMVGMAMPGRYLHSHRASCHSMR